jgi:oligoendopeptidase F
MQSSIPTDPQIFMSWKWSQIKPHLDELEGQALSSSNLDQWLMDWSDMNRLISEMYGRLWVDTTRDTANPQFKQRFNDFLDDIFTPSQAINQKLKQKLLSCGLRLDGFEVPLRNMQTEAEIFRDENLPLLAEEKKLANEYDEIIGAQTVVWEGEEIPLAQLQPVYLSQDRARREKAWRLSMKRRLADRQRINSLWVQLLDLHKQIAKNAGFSDYRA